MAEERLCEDGLVFDPFKRSTAHKCDHIFNVDCEERTELRKFNSLILLIETVILIILIN